MATQSSSTTTTRAAATSTPADVPGVATRLLAQYGCGPIQFSGTTDGALRAPPALRQRRATSRPPGRASGSRRCARSVRDVLSQRWVRTEQTYERENPKRIYYLSMEFLIGRSLANNITNLLLEPVARRVVAEQELDWLGLLEQEPDAGLGNGGLGRLAACFLDSMATMQLPGHGLRAALRVRHLQADDRGRLAARAAGQLAASPGPVGGRPPRRMRRGHAQLLVRAPRRRTLAARFPAGRRALIGIPFDRPVVGLRRQDHQHAAALGRGRARLLRLPGVQPGRLRRRARRDARGRDPHPGALSGRFDDERPGAALRAGVLPGRLLAGRPRAALPAAATPTGARCRRRSRSSSTTRIPRSPCRS